MTDVGEGSESVVLSVRPPNSFHGRVCVKGEQHDREHVSAGLDFHSSVTGMMGVR